MKYENGIIQKIDLVNSTLESLNVKPVLINEDFSLDSDFHQEHYLKFLLIKPNCIKLELVLINNALQLNIDRTNESFEWSENQIKQNNTKIKQMKIIQIVFLAFIFLSASPLFGQVAIRYTYDSQNRVKSVILPNGNTETYYYDKVGNRINQINVSTSINEQSSLKGDFNLFPNPTDRIFNLNGQLENEDNFEACLYDNQGKVILKRLIPSTTSIIEQFDVQNLANGTYLFVLKSNSGFRSWNIVKY